MQFTSAILSAITLGALAVSAAPLAKRESHTGRATWYLQNGNAGSCGNYNSDESKVIAVPEWMGENYCGKKVTIEYAGQSTEATIADTCPECQGANIDLSKGAFGSLADFGLGEMEVTWWIHGQ